jgi:hypothetical protein
MAIDSGSFTNSYSLQNGLGLAAMSPLQSEGFKPYHYGLWRVSGFPFVFHFGKNGG